MGMFDDLTCEVPVPGDQQPRHPSFQTKDFACLLDHYTIKADGTLWVSGDERIAAHQIPFHGMLNFYTYESDDIKRDGKDDGWWFEYEAKFTDGKLQGIEVVEIRRSIFGAARAALDAALSATRN